VPSVLYIFMLDYFSLVKLVFIIGKQKSEGTKMQVDVGK